MSAAMASGDVQMSVSQGVPPFVVAASAGQDIQVIDVAVSYSDNDNCVVHADLEIDKDSASELSGKKVAVPLGTAAHYGFLRQMSHFGIDLASLDVVNMPPPEGAAALAQKAVDFACGYGGGLTRMRGARQRAADRRREGRAGHPGLRRDLGAGRLHRREPGSGVQFLGVTAAANDKWNAGKDDAMLAVIAKESGMDLDAARSAIGTMRFPSAKEQLSDKWFGGNVQAFMKGVADVFVEAGSIDSALDTYENAVNAAPLGASQ